MTRPAAISASRWRRTAAGVRPKLALSATALCGPLLVQRPGNPVAGASVVGAAAGRASHRGASAIVADFTTPMLPISRPRYTHSPASRDAPALRSSAMTASTTGSTPASAAIAAAITWRPDAATVRRLALAVAGRQHRHRVDRRARPPDQLGPRLPYVAATARAATWFRPGAVVRTRPVEFGNRTLTAIVLVAVAAVFVARLAARHRAVPRLVALGLGHAAGVPAQIVVGGIVIFTHLNPWVVAGHFMLSMVLIAAATVLWWRTREPADRTRSRRPLPRSRAPASGAAHGRYLLPCSSSARSSPAAGRTQATRPRSGCTCGQPRSANCTPTSSCCSSASAVALAVCVTAVGAAAVARRSDARAGRRA